MQLSGGVFLAMSVVSSAAIAIVLRLFQVAVKNRFAIILGNYVTCVVLGFILLPEKTMIFHPETITIILGIIGGFLFVAGLVTMQISIQKNGAILTSAVGKLGLIIPLLMSILFFGERPGAMQIAGLLVVLFAMWVLSGKKETGSSFSLFWLLSVLFAGGFADGMVKVFNYVGNAKQNELYIWIVFCVAALLTVFLLAREKKNSGSYGQLKEFLAGILVGIPNYFCSAFLLRALATIPAFIAYTVFSTGTILLVTIVSTIVFRERPTKYQLIGLGMILVALLLLNM